MEVGDPEYMRAAYKRYYAKHGPRIRESKRHASRKRQYGLTPNEYARMIFLQNAACAICGKPQEAERWGSLSVDHNHATGKTRELLCSGCNRMLGYAHDDPDYLRLAAEYLEKHGSTGITSRGP
jgi:hypothetical protein